MIEPQTLLTIASWAWLLLPGLVSAIVVMVPRPRSPYLRVPIAILAGWTTCLAFAILVYNPVGTYAGHAAGMEDPEMRYDNNTGAIAILLGWVVPFLMAAVAQGFRGNR